MQKDLINNIAEYIFSSIDMQSLKDHKLENILIDTDSGQENIKLFGYSVFGFNFVVFDTSSLNEDSQTEMCLFIQYKDKQPYIIIYDGVYRAFILIEDQYIKCNLLSIGLLLVGIEQLNNGIFAKEKIESFNTEIIRNFIINVQ